MKRGIRRGKRERCRKGEQSAGEPSRHGSQPERTASCGPPAASARIPDSGRRPYLALPRGPGPRAAPCPPPSLTPGGAAPSRSKPAPRLRCRSERPRREQGSETEGAGEGGSACGGEAARAGEESPASDPPWPVPAPAAPRLRGAYRCGAPPGPACSAAGYTDSKARIFRGAPEHDRPAQHLRRHTVRKSTAGDPARRSGFRSDATASRSCAGHNNELSRLG